MCKNFLYGLSKILEKSDPSILYGKLERILRETIRKCVLDDTFGNIFRNANTVESRWP
jgi:hypothetical protein